MAVLQVLLTVIVLLPCSIASNCDCSSSYYTCFDVTEFGLDAFPLFGQPVEYFEVSAHSLNSYRAAKWRIIVGLKTALTI